MKPALNLPPHLTAIVEQEYPRFSDTEMTRRRALVERAMQDAGVDHLLVYGAGFRGGAVHWVCDWHTTYEAALVVTPGRRDTLFIQFYNHLPLARLMMPNTDVRWGGEATIQSVIAELAARGAKEGRVGVVGALPIGSYKALAAKYGDVKDLNRAYFGLRMVKSQEEIDWARIAARLSDLSIEALIRDIRPGIDERDLGAIVEGAYTPWGGSNVIHFFGVTSMADPQVCVPRQHPSTRKVQAGDVISTEITASFWDAQGQVLRTFFVGAEPTPLYKQLHETADAAFDAIFAKLRPGTHVRELAEAAKLIERAGFSFYDDVVHGYGGGYLPPVIGSPTRENGPLPDLTLQAGMMLVVQPNVITTDQKAGVQTGECVVITESDAESIHTAPRGPFRVG
ncbi:MAG: aminopeptidase P family protein [Bradyrhizobiaceae bacterium]|nr:aminopeptidase P family protein [Bradyrhizobiaceae bacterium]